MYKLDENTLLIDQLHTNAMHSINIVILYVLHGNDKT